MAKTRIIFLLIISAALVFGGAQFFSTTNVGAEHKSFFDAISLNRQARLYGVFIFEEFPEEVLAKDNTIQNSLGSGFVIKEDGKYYIVTNAHVAGYPQATFRILFYGSTAYQEAKPVGWDHRFDVALMQFVDDKFIPPGFVELGDSDILDSGDLVYIYGNPLGIKFLGSSAEIMSPPKYRALDSNYPGGLLAIDGTCNPGNSGGPIIISEGKVGALVIALTRSPSPICLGIPINNFKSLYSKLKAGGELKHGILGVSLIDLYELPKKIKKDPPFNEIKANIGVVVMEILKDGPADKAGIKPGDILLSFGSSFDKADILINSSGRFIEQINLKFFLGDSVVFHILRGHDHLLRKATLADPSLFVEPETKEPSKEKPPNKGTN